MIEKIIPEMTNEDPIRKLIRSRLEFKHNIERVKAEYNKLESMLGAYASKVNFGKETNND